MLPAGKKAPDFRLKSLAGATESLHEMARSGPVLAVFYKVSCPVCQLTLPFLERIRNNSRIRIVAISQDDSATTEKFNKTYHLTLDTLLDSSADRYPASNAYGITQVPSAFQVEPDATISHAWMGFSKADMEALGQRAAATVFEPGDKVPAFRPG